MRSAVEQIIPVTKHRKAEQDAKPGGALDLNQKRNNMLSFLCLRKSPADTPILNSRYFDINPGFDHIKEIVNIYDHPGDGKMATSISGKYVSIFREMNFDFVGQINHGISNCSQEWVYISADDELPPASLLLEFDRIIKEAEEFDVVAFPRMNLFPWKSVMGGKLFWPDYQSRLVRKHVRFMGDIHEVANVDPEKVLFMSKDMENAIQHIKTQPMQENSDSLYEKLAQSNNNK